MSNTKKSKDIIPLSDWHRTAVFYILLGVFIVVVPLLGFYANGYRYNFTDSAIPSVTITGGLYVATQVDESEIFLNESPVTETRFFRRATYIQGVPVGKHRIHVQGEGLQTWVKELPVYPQLVTEVTAFTLPEVAQVRPITPYINTDSEPVLQTKGSDLSILEYASSTVPVVVSTSTATTTFLDNPEFEFLSERFESEDVLTQNQGPEQLFRFVTDVTQTESTTTATSTVVRNDVKLYEDEGKVYAEYTGQVTSIPHYFCIPETTKASTTEHYGEHVAESIFGGEVATTQSTYERGVKFSQICRTRIRIDNGRQTIHSFAFAPNSNDLVVLQQENGVYVVEIDDRSWQNRQRLYPVGDVKLLVEGGQIFIKDQSLFLEVFLERG